MAADATTHTVPSQAHAAPVTGQDRRRSLPPADRIIRQIEAVDAWIAARRERERALQAPGLTRDERMDVAREVEALRRTHDAIKGCCARGLDAQVGPLCCPAPTAVLAHRHAWFVGKLAGLLADRGVTVLACTDNGAEALGVVVAEQPDLVLAGDRLAMVSGRALLAGARRYARGALLAVQLSDPREADALGTDADGVFLRHHPPVVVADALVELHLTATGRSSRA